MSEKKEEKRKNEPHVKMRKIRLPQNSTFGDQFRYIRGKGLVKRNEPLK